MRPISRRTDGRERAVGPAARGPGRAASARGRSGAATGPRALASARTRVAPRGDGVAGALRGAGGATAVGAGAAAGVDGDAAGDAATGGAARSPDGRLDAGGIGPTTTAPVRAAISGAAARARGSGADRRDGPSAGAAPVGACAPCEVARGEVDAGDGAAGAVSSAGATMVRAEATTVGTAAPGAVSVDACSSPGEARSA